MPKSSPSWSAAKRQLAALDHADLVRLLGDLYAASPEARTFIGTRLGLAGDPVAPYRATIRRWCWPDVMRAQRESVQKARRAITEYRRATRDPVGTADLMVCYCEQASGFIVDVGNDDEAFLYALAHMFDAALTATADLPAADRDRLRRRLGVVVQRSREIGWGVGDAISVAWAATTAARSPMQAPQNRARHQRR